MAEGHATLFTREWWITVVLVGLGIHLLASYLKPRLDQIGGWFSRSWAARNEAHAKELQERIDQLKRSRTARVNATTEEFRARLSGIQWAVLSLVSFILVVLVGTLPRPHSKWLDIVTLLLGGLAFTLAINDYRNAIYFRIEMLQAEKQQLEAEKKKIEAEMGETLSQLGITGENGDPKDEDQGLG